MCYRNETRRFQAPLIKSMVIWFIVQKPLNAIRILYATIHRHRIFDYYEFNPNSLGIAPALNDSISTLVVFERRLRMIGALVTLFALSIDVHLAFLMQNEKQTHKNEGDTKINRINMFHWP